LPAAKAEGVVGVAGNGVARSVFFFISDSPIEPANRGDFHSGELLRCQRIFLFMNLKFNSLQKCVLRLAFHPL